MPAGDSVTVTLTDGEAVELAVMLEEEIARERERIAGYRADGGRKGGWGLCMDTDARSIQRAQSVIRKIDTARARLPAGRILA